jgi:3-hydroxybutyryl-CoA dehydrogenase
MAAPMADTETRALNVGVVGAGTMGAGIAQVCLQAGHEVQLHDVDHAAIERGRARIADGLQKLVEKGKLSPYDRQQMLDSLHDAHSLGGLALETDIVIEAALEDMELKQTIFRALGASAAADSILATNTSALSVTEIAESSGVPDRVLGLHFFNPAPLMPLVEVVATRDTSTATLNRATTFVEALGKQPILTADSPGFIVNRVNRPFTLEALRMLEAGEAGVEQIDRAVQSAGYPMGPLTLMDLVGIDVNLAVATALWEGFDEAVRFAPSPIQGALVAAGRLGRKTSEGFYRYEHGRSVGLSPTLADDGVQDVAGNGLTDEEIVSRIELAIINEAYHATGEGVATPPDIDRALMLGANHPYGPFERAGQLGLRNVIDGLAVLEDRYGERFRVAPSLWQIASI